jgi:hypothetical protein
VEFTSWWIFLVFFGHPKNSKQKTHLNRLMSTTMGVLAGVFRVFSKKPHFYGFCPVFGGFWVPGGRLWENPKTRKIEDFSAIFHFFVFNKK